MTAYRNRIEVSPVPQSAYQKETAMKFEVEIPLVLLKAAMICTAKDDVRFYLVGIAIDQGHVVSTDGHRAFYAPLENVAKDTPQVIIPRLSIEFFIKKVASELKKHADEATVTVQIDGENGTLRTSTVSEHFQPINGKFPEWRRIIPKASVDAYQGGDLSFNWKYMEDFQKIAKILGSKNSGALLIPNKEANQAALIEFVNPRFTANGILMPMRL